MATSVTCSAAIMADGQTYDGQIMRTNLVAASFLNESAGQVRGGVMPSGGGMVVTAGAGMSVNIGSGYALCPSSSGSTYGGYLFGLMSAANLTVATSDATNPRIDAVVAYVDDPGTSSGYAAVEILTGNPTAGATLSNLAGAPVTPDNGMVLAYLVVPANSASVTSGNIATYSQFTVAQGGILPNPYGGSPPAGYTGLYVHDVASGRLCHDPSGTLEQPVLLPFTPQQDGPGAETYTDEPTAKTVASVNVTVDGSTDLEIHFSWQYFSQSGTPSFAQVKLLIDSTVVWTSGAEPGSTGYINGGAFIHHTQSGTDRPSSGSHTISVTYADGTASTGQPTTIGPTELYVRAATL